MHERRAKNESPAPPPPKCFATQGRRTLSLSTSLFPQKTAAILNMFVYVMFSSTKHSCHLKQVVFGEKNPILQIPASHSCGIFRHVWRTVFPNLVSGSKLYDANARRGNISIKARAAVTSVCVYLQWWWWCYCAALRKWRRRQRRFSSKGDSQKLLCGPVWNITLPLRSAAYQALAHAEKRK